MRRLLLPLVALSAIASALLMAAIRTGDERCHGRHYE